MIKFDDCASLNFDSKMSETITDSSINTNEVISKAFATKAIVTEVVKKGRAKKVKELTAEQVEAKKKADEEKVVKKAAKEKEKDEKKVQREKEAEQKKKEKEVEKKKKASLLLQAELDKTNRFRVPTSSVLVDKSLKRKLQFMTHVYDIIKELAPELINDLSVRTAYNQVIECFIKHSECIYTYPVNYKDKYRYTWFTKKVVPSTLTDIERSFLYNYSFTNFSGYYYIPNGRSIIRGSDEHKKYYNNILECSNTYQILYDMIYPIINPRANEKVKQLENARIVAENKAKIKGYKDSIIEYRTTIKGWKDALRKLDVEGTTYNELFGDDSLRA